jgi:YD repeat-containing protein
MTTVAGASIVVDKVIDSKTKLEIPQLITTTLPSGLKNIVQLDKTYAENGTDTSKTTYTVTNNTKVSRVYSDTQTGTQTNTSPESRSVSYRYDPLTQQLTNAKVNGLEVSSYQYDIRGRLALATSGDRVTRYNYNDLVSKGGLTSITDAGQQTTAFEYDLMGRVNKITYHDGRILEQSYDNNGNLASLTPPGQPTHYFNYDSVDKETDYTPSDVTGVVDPSTRYDYYRDRKLTTITRPDSQQLHFNYSAGINQLASMDIPHGRYSYDYNTHGVITGINAPDDGSLTFTYDASLPLSHTWSGVVAGSVSQSYNTDFIVTQQCINAANCIDYQYDLDGLLTNAGTLAISREAKKDGLINGTTLQNINMTRCYNLHGEMDTETTQYDTTRLQSATYLRDKLGHITQRSLTLQGAKSTDDYSYDQAGRLAKVINGALTTSYTFDDNGNRLSKSINDAATTTTVNGIYDAQYRLTSYGNCAYQDSANGELQQKTCTVGKVIETNVYIYDVLGNLLQVTLPDAAKIDYIIDGQNRRISKKVGDTLVQGFLYGDQLNLVAELDASNNIVSKFVYGIKVNVPDYMIKGGVTYQIISDHLGSPRLVVNASTGVVA